jgi:hypothetical protein
VLGMYERKRPLTNSNRLHLAFPLQLPILVELPPMSPGSAPALARYEVGDMLILADTMPNGDPLVMFARREAFESDYKAVPYETETSAAHGGVTAVTVSVDVTYKDGTTRTFIPLAAANMPPDKLRRMILDIAADIAHEVSKG